MYRSVETIEETQYIFLVHGLNKINGKFEFGGEYHGDLGRIHDRWNFG